LVSFDSTIKANISVCPPIDLVIYETDTFRIAAHQRVKDNDTYFNELRRHWSDGLRNVFANAPDPPWEMDGGAEPRIRLRHA
jgi:putative proteasome-type protease